MEIQKISDYNYRIITKNASHSIMNLLQTELLKNEYVEFAGYNQPHPLEKYMEMIVKTKVKTPKEVINESIDKLILKFNKLEN